MSETQSEGLCPAPEMATLIDSIGGHDEDAIGDAEALLLSYPDDPRLHFLKGSVLAGMKRYDEACEAMAIAIAIAPDYTVARFQLGLLELSSGRPDAAEATWQPLENLPDDHYLRHFSDGLRLLIRDDFAGAIGRLTAGLARNDENPAMNADMQLIIEEARLKGGGAEEPISSVQQLLLQSSKSTRH